MQDDSLTDNQQHEIVANDMLAEWLGECRFSARKMLDIDDALALLATKRTTLEEKIIRKELHILVSKYCAILTHVHEALADDLVPELNALAALRLLNLRVHGAMGELLKALRHNFNYVEQYFEFDFCARLTQHFKFVDEAQEVITLVSREKSKP